MTIYEKDCGKSITVAKMQVTVVGSLSSTITRQTRYCFFQTSTTVLWKGLERYARIQDSYSSGINVLQLKLHKVVDSNAHFS